MLPTHQKRLTLGMNMMQAITAMTDGNPGAMNAIVTIMQAAPAIDPKGAMGGFGPIMNLDMFGIYGSSIYVLFSDICGKNAARMIAVVRATQLGMFSARELQNASNRQDYSGRDMVPVLDLYKKVRERLPDFDTDNAAGFNADELGLVV
jgi:hypothetical protein